MMLEDIIGSSPVRTAFKKALVLYRIRAFFIYNIGKLNSKNQSLQLQSTSQTDLPRLTIHLSIIDYQPYKGER